MITVFAQTTRPSSELVCHLMSTKTTYPSNWPDPIPEQRECKSVDEIKSFIKETNAELVNFYFRANGIPARPVKVSDTTKLDKAFKALEKWGK